MKVLKNKTIIGIIAIAFGILICFILTPLYNKSLEAKTKVVQVEKYIEKGKKIAEDDIKLVEIGSYNLPEEFIKSKSKVIGSYAATEMYPSEYVIPKKLSPTPLSKDEYLENLDGENGAISITLQNFAAGLSGKLLSGDIVSILATDPNDKQTYIPTELKYVKVLASTTANGKDMDEQTNDNSDTEEDTIPSTVTLLVSDRQASVLANLEVTQKVHIELVYRGTSEESIQFLNQQKKIIEEIDQAVQDDAQEEQTIEREDEKQSNTKNITDNQEKAAGDDNE